MAPLSVQRSFLLFAISGFAGLIYESVWSQYLKLLLGHAAHARTVVLIIFMGGMAFGSWLAARHFPRGPNLLAAYAIVEVVVGVAGLLFHGIFDASTAFAYDTVMPAIGNPTAVAVFKWSLAGALVAPQSILLGMTFPLMSAALVRRFPEHAGNVIGNLYFTNSLGAALGILVSGFLLIPTTGLPGTVLVAGILNLCLALVVWLMARSTTWCSDLPVVEATPSAVAVVPRLLLIIAFATGAASFIYEIGWLRMLSLVLGASTHAFELMIAAFVFGLALGALWIRGRIDTLGAPLRVLGVVQVIMGIFALATLLIYDATFDVMAYLMSALERNDAGYALFNVSSHVIALMVMLPVTVCAGMTLPLITRVLLRTGNGERAIGYVYAANTVGAIAGVIVAVHLLMPLVGLKGLICVGAAVDIVAGAVLLLRRDVPYRLRWPMVTVVGGAMALVGVTVAVELDPRKMTSGIFSMAPLIQWMNQLFFITLMAKPPPST